MSLRPRFGDGGLLTRPAGVRDEPLLGWTVGDVIGSFAPDRDWDPFERTPGGLLLAEDFARADLVAFDAAAEWYLQHGVLDLHDLFPREKWRTRGAVPPGDSFHDAPVDVWQQQFNVQWLLLALARLSLGEEAWEPRWMEVAVAGAGESLWLDTEDRRKIRFRASLQSPAPHPIGTLWVPAEQWYEAWSGLPDGQDLSNAESFVPLLPSRAGHIELVRRLLEPHVRIGARFEVELLWPKAEYPLLVRERRRWRSALPPIYLQLLEALRRITDGQRGAGFCRECGQPFLTLDARRSSFCTDKDRFRFSQRERRKRVDRERAAVEAIAKMHEVGPRSIGTLGQPAE